MGLALIKIQQTFATSNQRMDQLFGAGTLKGEKDLQSFRTINLKGHSNFGFYFRIG
jgi:hypothetical protein